MNVLMFGVCGGMGIIAFFISKDFTQANTVFGIWMIAAGIWWNSK